MDDLVGKGLQRLFGDAEKMRKRMEGVQQTLKDMRVTGVAGGDAVRVTTNGERRVLRVEIGERCMGDRPMLEDLVAAAVNDAMQKVEDAAGKEIQSSLSGALSES